MHELNEWCSQAYENAKIYKKKVKAWHDCNICKHKLHLRKKILLFNSRLCLFQGKLKLHWSGPFVIKEVFPYSAVEIALLNCTNVFKVNRQRVKAYYIDEKIASKVFKYGS